MPLTRRARHSQNFRNPSGLGCSSLKWTREELNKDAPGLAPLAYLRRLGLDKGAEGHATWPGSEPSDSENPLMNARLPRETEVREAQEDR